MRDAGVYDYSFDDLFENKMRLAIPLDTDDSRSLKTVITTIRKEGYNIPSDDEEAWQPGMPTPKDPGKFNRRRVKQKLRRLGTGEEYEIEITYAPHSEENEVITLETENIEWSMNQYQRNRKDFTWKIIEKSA